jgi:hypothetical protein
MAKSKQNIKLQKRDWAIIILFLAIIGTNWVWYQHSVHQDTINKALVGGNNISAQAWLQNQIEINKLDACINNNMRPCSMTTTQQ